LDTRPLVCRLYPYVYNSGGFHAELEAGCPYDLLDPGETLMETLHMSLAQARAWHHTLYEEIMHDDEDWPDLRLAV
jgi:Fe-S-cluster containining protein